MHVSWCGGLSSPGPDFPPHSRCRHLGPIPHPSYLDYCQLSLLCPLNYESFLLLASFSKISLSLVYSNSQGKIIYPGASSSLRSLISAQRLEHGLWYQARCARISALLLSCCVTFGTTPDLLVLQALICKMGTRSKPTLWCCKCRVS